jgi:hypothetical protein
MENTRKFDTVLETIAWGALFLLWGITEMFTSLPDGTGALGVGVILVGLNLVLLWKGLPMNGFTGTMGILALVLGGLLLTQSLLHLSFDLPVFAILLLVLGAILLGRALLLNRNEG